jgi:hypothetical protein
MHELTMDSDEAYLPTLQPKMRWIREQKVNVSRRWVLVNICRKDEGVCSG